MARDIEYLLSLGVPVEEIARRAGRTSTAIQAELDAHRAEQAKRAKEQQDEDN